jgi:hypothetical protein
MKASPALAIVTRAMFPMRERRHASGRSSRATSRGVGVVLLLVVACLPGLGRAQDDAELAQKSQNPVADLIAVPFEHDLNFGVGPGKDLQYVLQVQPVIPFRLTPDWNLISRTIVPLVDQPELAPGFGDVFGLGDIQESLFLSPARPGQVIWGVGPILQFPTATDDALGQGKWGAGPTAVALTIQGPWLFGALIANVWSFAGDDDRPGREPDADPAFRHLHFPRRVVPGIGAYHHRRLEGGRRRSMDRPAGRRRGEACAAGEAAGERIGRGVLQRRAPGQRGRVAAAHPDPVPVPEVRPDRSACPLSRVEQ